MNDRSVGPENGPIQPNDNAPEPKQNRRAWDAVTPPFSLPEDLLDEVPNQPNSADFNRASVRVSGTRRRPTAQPQQTDIPTERGYGCADIVTAIFLLLTVAVCGFTGLLWSNPQSPLNPFPPPTFPAVMILASPPPTLTPSNTPTPLPPTPTPLATLTFTPTATFTITYTPTATDTPVVGLSEVTATETPVDAPLPEYTLSPFPFTVEPIKYTSNTGPEGCSWQSIAGSVVDLAGNPVKGMAIRVTGSNGNIDEVNYTGTQPRFGEGGFEIFLGAIPRQDQYTVQLLARTGTPISDTIPIQSRSGCKDNVVVIRFVQNHAY
jgi:hypothetical protein